ncbi:MAG: hypothetical protein ACOYI8_07345 [Christensenellales bacterium]|jgi:hypothetical protein
MLKYDITRVLSLPWAKTMLCKTPRYGNVEFGNSKTYMLNDGNYDAISFDISNNKVLGNMGRRGELKALTIFRDTYRANENGDSGWPGVWLHKDFMEYRDYRFDFTINGEQIQSTAMDVMVGFIENILPAAKWKAANFEITLILCTPIDVNACRPRGAIYAAHIQNLSDAKLEAVVELPRLFSETKRLNNRAEWRSFRGDDLEMRLLDAEEDAFSVTQEIHPNTGMWVSVGLYAPGDPQFLEQMRERNSARWMLDTIEYYTRLYGRISLGDEPLYGEFVFRMLMHSAQCISMDEEGNISGSNWGTNPSHFAIWIKDMYYALLPGVYFDPATAKLAILWFVKYGVRHPGHLLKGGVAHSLSVALAPLIYSGIYLRSTGDIEFFRQNRELHEHFSMLINTMLDDRIDKNKYLFTTHYLSDGETYADWHTGTNICAYAALRAMALICDVVYIDHVGAEEYDRFADRTREDILKYCVLESDCLNEGAYSDGRPPIPFFDGEESDVTLMATYDFCGEDDTLLQKTMRFAMSEANVAYNVQMRCIRWLPKPNETLSGIPATMPGYMKGIARLQTRAEFTDEDGALWNLLKVADADGGLWWWPYGGMNGCRRESPRRGDAVANGKAGWATGVISVLFLHRIVGLSYDALKNTLTIAPHAVERYSWKGISHGNARFDIEYSPELLCVTSYACKPITIIFDENQSFAKQGETVRILCR